jgi:hypothetical protein
MRYLLAMVVLLFLPSAAVAETATDKAQKDCAISAYKSYLAASIALYQRDQLMSIDGVIAKRRLMEGYCVQFVQCLNLPELAMGAIFSKCLDDEDADRINDGK